MNERILKLFEQSLGVNYIPAPIEDHVPSWTEKFAELIVRECEQVSLKNSHRNDDMGAIIAKQIKKHFGVER